MFIMNQNQTSVWKKVNFNTSLWYLQFFQNKRTKRIRLEVPQYLGRFFVRFLEELKIQKYISKLIDLQIDLRSQLLKYLRLKEKLLINLRGLKVVLFDDCKCDVKPQVRKIRLLININRQSFHNVLIFVLILHCNFGERQRVVSNMSKDIVFTSVKEKAIVTWSMEKCKYLLQGRKYLGFYYFGC